MEKEISEIYPHVYDQMIFGKCVGYLINERSIVFNQEYWETVVECYFVHVAFV